MDPALKRRINRHVGEATGQKGCPHCGSLRIKRDKSDGSDQNMSWRLLPTVVCLDCSHEWLPSNEEILEEQ